MTKKQQIPQQQQAAISMKIIVPMRPIPSQSPKLGPSTSHSKIGIIWLHLWHGSLTTQHFYYHNLVRIYKRNNPIVLGNVHKGRPTILGHFGHTYLPMSYTVVKWGHTEGIEREKTSSKNISLVFWWDKLFLVFQIWGQNTIGGQLLEHF